MHDLQAVVASEFPGRIVVVETRRPVRHWWITAALLASFAACSGNDRLPNLVTGPTPTPTGLIISGADTVLSGLSDTYSARLTFADGTSMAVIPAWSTDDGNIATINAAGQLTALRNGTTRIVANAGGLVGRVAIRVVSNYRGSWHGDFAMRACGAEGVLRGWCFEGEYSLITEHGILDVSQSGDRVEAQLWMGAGNPGSGPLAGIVTSEGRLNLAGAFRVDFKVCSGSCITLIDRPLVFTITPWDTSLSGADEMSGAWVEQIVSVNDPGIANIEWELRSMRRFSQ